ncbi:protein kinase domain-containing protein [Nocardia cyriacigeorgica]|uniref:protein kinase domain-containing protein n=1 Tax=Nocardia cyriacigeorgica TaxID=135487 RepID=UPI002455F070|nr:protein kinase [Nocardia cyriacigeorgica]
MTGDPYATQRGVSGSVVAELAAAGFDDAVEIGRGGFGTVFRCTQASLDRVVAVKVLLADLDDDNVARFLREQRAAGRLTGHPNIVDVLHTGATDNGRPFIVMPFYPHGSLAARIRDHGTLPLPMALRVGVKMAGALATAHRAGIVHRDVKPANILFTAYDEPTLVDFGIAHIAGGFVTAAGIVTGTPAFTAPEVIAGEPPGPAADIYGLGATVFAAITGHAAFERRSGEQLVAQFLRITSEPIPDLRDRGISEEVGAVVERAMCSDPHDRPSATELGEQLRAAQRHHGFPIDEMALSPTTADVVASEHDKPRPSEPPDHQPPRSAMSSGHHAVPLELTSFIDRRTELAAATNALSTSRLVTLTGIGGVGKTRLAVKVLADARPDFADGVAFVELGEVHDESLLEGILAGALGLPDRSARPLRELLVEYLSGRELLILLDNCEQMTAAVAGLAETLLRACPGLRILATSREPIGIAGESLLPIHPLAVPDPDRPPQLPSTHDAVTLFADRAAAVVAGFELTADNMATIARICRRLDGLPLPIELAAARLSALSPEQILARLTDRFALLTRGHRGAPPRQQTLRTCIDWSHDLCSPTEQRAWAQLSVFAGDFGIEAAQHICADLDAAELLDTLALLVEKSILTREQSGATVRFRMLGTVRDYGREKAQQRIDYLDLCRRHRDWCEQLAADANADWAGPRALEHITRLGREETNLRQALEFCVDSSPDIGIRIAAAIWPYWFSQGALTEARRWLSRLLTRCAEPLTVDQAAASYAACLMAAVQGDLPAATALVRRERPFLTPSTGPLIQAHIDLADGVLALFSGNLSAARPHLEQAAGVYEQHLHVQFEVDALTNLGLTYELQHNTTRAIECYEHALALTEQHGETIYRSYVLWSLAVALWRQGNLVRTTTLLAESLQMSRTVGDRTNASACLQVLAWIAAEEHDAERAVVLTTAAEQIGGSVGASPIQLPDLLVHQQTCERLIREAMSDEDYSAARRQGARLSLTTAIAYALYEEL